MPHYEKHGVFFSPREIRLTSFIYLMAERRFSDGSRI